MLIHESIPFLHYKELKIKGHIAEVGYEAILSFSSTERQIKRVSEKVYHECQKVNAVIHVIAAGVKLKSSMERKSDLSFSKANTEKTALRESLYQVILFCPNMQIKNLKNPQYNL